jgi:hypothetical protein
MDLGPQKRTGKESALTVKHAGKITFTSLLLLIGLLFLFLTLPLGRMAQLVPFRVVIPTVGLLLFQLTIELYDRKNKHLKAPLQSYRVPPVGSSDLSEDPGQVQEYLILGMIAFLPVLIYLVGFILSATLFIWLYYRFFFRKPFILTASLSLGTAAFLYFLLVLLLGMDINSGIIWSLSTSAF